ncbi:MAG: cation transporter [Deltaproteobacteria bacterium]|nr:cation transporter [Deltaproteobacteria bacterium]
MKGAHAIKRVFLLTFFLNVVIATLETSYGLWTNTLSMIANGLHSYMDGGSSLLGYFALAVAAQPSDENHHYGHQKYETISALGISIFIILTAWEIGKHAIERFLEPSPSEFHYSGIIVVLISMATNFAVSSYERRKGQELHSHALEADAAHTMTDVWVSITVLFSLICIYYNIQMVDTLFSLLIALFFLHTAYRIIRKNVLVLTDAAFIDVAQIKQLVRVEKEVIDCHHIRTRGTPGNAFVDMHIQIPPEMTTLTAHRLVHRIEDNVKKNIEGICEVMIHTEPFPDDDEKFVTDEITIL